MADVTISRILEIRRAFPALSPTQAAMLALAMRPFGATRKDLDEAVRALGDNRRADNSNMDNIIKVHRCNIKAALNDKAEIESNFSRDNPFKKASRYFVRESGREYIEARLQDASQNRKAA